MDVKEIIRNWPQWRNANAESIISSPAFCMPVVYCGSESLVTSEMPVEDSIDLELRFDDANCVLSLGDSVDFPELHSLWSRHRELPSAILLALVEVECGNMLQLLENIAQAQLSVVGLLPPGSERPAQRNFQLGNIHFAMDLPLCLTMALGKLDNLDCSHRTIRSLTREVFAHYASIELEAKYIATLKPGDMLLLPDEYETQGLWFTEPPQDAALHLRSANGTPISFAEFADDNLPAVPPPADLLLCHKSQVLAEGILSTIGERKCFKLTRLR